MAIYLLHISPPYRHAVHYLGFSEDVAPRVHAHMHGQGARLTQVAVAAGCTLTLARVWEDGDRALEKKLKARHGSVGLCPICREKGLYMKLSYRQTHELCTVHDLWGVTPTLYSSHAEYIKRAVRTLDSLVKKGLLQKSELSGSYYVTEKGAQWVYDFRKRKGQ